MNVSAAYDKSFGSSKRAQVTNYQTAGSAWRVQITALQKKQENADNGHAETDITDGSKAKCRPADTGAPVPVWCQIFMRARTFIWTA